MSGPYYLSNYDWIITSNEKRLAFFLFCRTHGRDGFACEICEYRDKENDCAPYKCDEGIEAWLKQEPTHD